MSTPSLPPIPHILPALRAALDADPFWGPTYWPYLLSRANQLSGGIQYLISDCVDLEVLVSSTQASTRTGVLRTPSGQLVGQGRAEEKGAKLWKSKLAKRQLRMKGEETEYMRRCALQCWAKAALPNKMRGQILGLDTERRGRRLSSP